jgi:O-antigen/teichoic acid export membrane protein
MMGDGRVRELVSEEQGAPLSLKKRIVRGTAWTLSGHVINQGLRLVSNVILTRLLLPEAFGLMALVYTFLSGLEMFSDTGVGPSIVQNKRGDDPAFLNTGWTLQTVRGVVLWIVACAIAPSIANLYNEPMVGQLLPVLGVLPLVQGMTSTKVIVANRQLNLSKITTLEIGVQVFGLAAMVAGAWVYKSVWALAIGTIVAAIVKMILTHIIFEGSNNRFQWDKSAAQELHKFGRWVFLSTILTFFAMQGDRLLIPKFEGVAFFGIYTVAFTLSRSMSEVVRMIGSRVLFPTYSEVVRERPEDLYSMLRRTRVIMLALSWVSLIPFIFFGQYLIGFLYKGAYADAGWILQVLSIGLLVDAIGHTYDNVLLAQGNTFAMSALKSVQMVLQLAGIWIGHSFGGPHGMIIGIAAVGWLMYPAQAICYAKTGMWQPEVDFPLIVAACAIAYGAFLFAF